MFVTEGGGVDVDDWDFVGFMEIMMFVCFLSEII